jgi:hypothetical protein
MMAGVGLAALSKLARTSDERHQGRRSYCEERLLQVYTQGARAAVCPDSDPDIQTIRQDIDKSIETLQKQIELLAQRLLCSQVRLNELKPRPENTEKLPIRLRRYRLILIR